MPKESWFCDKCGTKKVVHTPEGVRCAICGGKLYLAEKQTYKQGTENLRYIPKTKTLIVKEFIVTCPNCKKRIKFNFGLNIGQLIEHILGQEGKK